MGFSVVSAHVFALDRALRVDRRPCTACMRPLLPSAPALSPLPAANGDGPMRDVGICKAPFI